MCSASSTFLPRTRSATRRTFCGEAFRYFSVAFERARQRELAELVADHVLRDVHRDELAAVVHGDGVTDHVRNDRRPARPGLDDLLVALAIHGVDFLLEMLVDERTLL